MRAIAIIAFLLVASTAHAQAPDQAPYPPPPPPAPAPPPPTPAPMPPAGSYVPPYAMAPVQLTADDHAILQRGEISSQQQLGGAVANALLGFGVGQAIQGRWSETGWIFTLGMGGSLALMIGGAVQGINSCEFDNRCNDDGAVAAILVGAIGITVFYIWGIVDAVTGPQAHNRRVRELRMRLGIPQPLWSRAAPYVTKGRDGGGTAGVLLRF